MKFDKNYQIEGIATSVTIIGDLTHENSGIGYYEYWGAKGYDAGVDYWEMEDVKWHEERYTPKENEIITKYVYDNWAAIEKDLSKYANSYDRI